MVTEEDRIYTQQQKDKTEKLIKRDTGFINIGIGFAMFGIAFAIGFWLTI